MKLCGGATPAPGMAAPRGPSAMPSEVRGQITDRPASARDSRLGDRFARALDEQSGQEDLAPPRETEPPIGLRSWPPSPPAACAGMAPPPALPAAVPRASTPAVTAAGQPAEIAAPAPVARPDSGQGWELSITEPGGFVLSLRAERVAVPASATAAATAPAWLLAIDAPAAQAAALQRHAPRLAQRLAARALAPAHVRIDARHESQHGD